MCKKVQTQSIITTLHWNLCYVPLDPWQYLIIYSWVIISIKYQFSVGKPNEKSLYSREYFLEPLSKYRKIQLQLCTKPNELLLTILANLTQFDNGLYIILIIETAGDFVRSTKYFSTQDIYHIVFCICVWILSVRSYMGTILFACSTFGRIYFCIFIRRCEQSKHVLLRMFIPRENEGI